MKDPGNAAEQRDSKSQRKRQMLALQKIGALLVELPTAQLAQVPLDSTLAEAIATARTLTSHGAKRRQLQYIGKLMRDTDPEPIQTALDNLQLKNQQGKAKFHHIERWRDRLIAEGDKALQEFLTQFPTADSQHLRQLIRKAQQEHTAQKSGADTVLFRYLREIINPT